MRQEKWVVVRDYQGHKFDGKYEVSCWGNVRNVETKKPLSKYCDNRGLGYLRVKMIDTNGVRVALKIHRLVALYFCPRPSDMRQFEDVNHIDGNTRNNSFSNLEWVTHEENIKKYVENCTKEIVNESK